jgi:hypothetical protein
MARSSCAKKAADKHADPVIGKFLRFLTKDMAAHPAGVRAIPCPLLARGAALVKGVEVDLDAALPDDGARATRRSRSTAGRSTRTLSSLTSWRR